ncbi:MAG: toxin glutamine deamidase domain-containing protein [Fibrobacter sp.]|nr:toxin glutamine deamidase domain-containing protein [Fibrobacter sp.]
MAKKNKFDPLAYDRQHRANLAARAKKIKAIFDSAAQKAVVIGLASGFKDPEKDFILEKHPAARKRIDAMIDTMHDDLVDFITDAEEAEWHLANAKNDAMVDAIAARTSIARRLLDMMKQTNLTALAAFQERKVAGMGLSDRVWNLTDKFKGELELAMEMGIGSGKSAADISRDVRQYLNEPDKLFRRVRDEKGVLHLSKAAAAYHPGQGVYRSSYKNALRMTATETNMAYRTADHERWQQNPCVIGIEIHLSNNHTIKNSKGEPEELHDICDELQGTYPKEFKFVGWHPNCRCVAVAKLCSDDEFIEYNQRILDGEDVSDFEFSGKIDKLPDNFNQWVEDNQERIDRSKTLPYFLSDNADMVIKANPKAGIGELFETKESKRISTEAYNKPENLVETRMTNKQKENIKDIASELGIEPGKPMNFWEANERRGNVNYGKERDFELNCINSVFAHELRLRGLDVTAVRPFTAEKGTEFYGILEHPEQMFKNPGVKVLKDKKGVTAGMLNKATKERGRYHLSFDVEGTRYGHTMTAERLPDGHLVIYDAQSGRFWSTGFLSAVSRSAGLSVTKVDGLLFREGLAEKMVCATEKAGNLITRKAKRRRR